MQFPTVIGGVSIINVPGVNPGRLRLTGSLLGEIYMGRITRWNDPQIAKINPQIKMPPMPITVVHRSDGSGTSFIFTSFLSMKNANWAKAVGASDLVSWPVGLGGKGNDGVAAFVKQTKGSIGYVEYVYAKKNATSHISGSEQGWQLPAAERRFLRRCRCQRSMRGKTPGNSVMLLDQPGATAWPISGATFILMYKQSGQSGPFRQCAQILRLGL